MKKTLLVPALALFCFACSDESSALEKNANDAQEAFEDAADYVEDAAEEAADELEDAVDGH